MNKTPEQNQGGGELLLSKIEVRSEREGGLIDAMVPIDLIDRTEVAVDEEHVAELAASMHDEWSRGITNGQLSPILLGQIEGRSTFSLIDGFHRDAALKLLGNDTVFATIRPNTTEEEVGDLRILTANSHSSVSFARIVEWVNSSWSKSPWADKVSAAQAFSLANSKTANGRRMGLTEEEAGEVREWALDKSKRWSLSTAVIWTNLSTADVADPALVKQVRGRTNGHTLEALTSLHLREIATAYPHQFEIQNALNKVILAQSLTVPETKQVLEAFKGAQATEDILATIELTDWHALFENDKLAKKKGKQRVRSAEEKAQEDEERKPAMPLLARSFYNKYSLSRVAIARLQLENSVFKGEYLVAPLHGDTQPGFIVDLPSGTQLQKATQPSIDSTAEDRFLTRFETLESKLLEVFINATNADEADARHAIQRIGNRIGQDMRTGGLQYVDLHRDQTFDELIRTCMRDEVRIFKEGSEANISAISREVDHYDFSIVSEILPALEDKTQTSLVSTGMLQLGVHSVAQILQLNRTTTSQLLDTTHQRLTSAQRAYEKSTTSLEVVNS